MCLTESHRLYISTGSQCVFHHVCSETSTRNVSSSSTNPLSPINPNNVDAMKFRNPEIKTTTATNHPLPRLQTPKITRLKKVGCRIHRRNSFVAPTINGEAIGMRTRGRRERPKAPRILQKRGHPRHWEERSVRMSYSS